MFLIYNFLEYIITIVRRYIEVNITCHIQTGWSNGKLGSLTLASMAKMNEVKTLYSANPKKSAPKKLHKCKQTLFSL